MFSVSDSLTWLEGQFGTMFSLQEERCWDDEKGAGMIVTCTLFSQLFEVAFWRPKSWKQDWLLAGASRIADKLEIFRAKWYIVPGSYRQFKLVCVNGELVIGVLAGKGPKSLRLSQVFLFCGLLPQSQETTARNSIVIAGDKLDAGGDIAELMTLKFKTSKAMNIGYDLSAAEEALVRLEQAAKVKRRNAIARKAEAAEQERLKAVAKASEDKKAAEEQAKLRRKAERDARRKELGDRTLRKWLTAYAETGERVFGCPLTAEEYAAGFHYVANHGDLFLVVTGWDRMKAKAETAIRHFRLTKKSGVIGETEVKEQLSFTRPEKAEEKVIKVDKTITLIDSDDKYISAMVITSDEIVMALRQRGTNHGRKFVRTDQPDESGRYLVFAFSMAGVDTVGLMAPIDRGQRD